MILFVGVGKRYEEVLAAYELAINLDSHMLLSITTKAMHLESRIEETIPK